MLDDYCRSKNVPWNLKKFIIESLKVIDSEGKNGN